MNISGQDAKYMTAMEKAVAMLDTATVSSTFQSAGNSFVKIGDANPGEWLPPYYQSYCYVMIGTQEKEKSKQDEYYDKAEQLAMHADSISPDNSEICVLRSFVNSMKISVDSINRGQILGMQSVMLNEKAIMIDSDNPRAYLMKGSGLMLASPLYGGGKDKAIPVLEMSVEKFRTVKPENKIVPHWGKARAVSMLEQCRKEN